MTNSDSLDFIGDGDSVNVYFDSTADNSFFGNWTCFKEIKFDLLSGDVRWLGDASQKFKDAVTQLTLKGTWGAKNLDVADVKEYVNLSLLVVMPGRESIKTISMGDISSLNFVKEIYIQNVNVSNLKYLPLRNIVKLQLVNCNVSSIYYLKDCVKLGYLNLNNNPLSDISYDNGGNSMSSIQILKSLNSDFALKSLFIEGNMFTNTKELKNLNWNEKSGF